MTAKNALIASAMGAALALGGAAANTAAADGHMEKCYGVVKAGKNDCATKSTSCAGHSKIDGQQDAFIALPKGTCDKIVGGSTKAPGHSSGSSY